MRHHFYELTASADFLSFTFNSLSEERIVLKRIELSKISSNLYNLSFGDLNDESELDDLVVTNNRDTEKVLATVTEAIIIFLRAYPAGKVFFTGSTMSRTRFYRIIINREQPNWRESMEIYGILDGQMVCYEGNVEFEGFVIKLKKYENS